MKRFRGQILYEPSGRALETARFIAGDTEPIVVCNSAKSCSHMCGYCYCPSFLKIPSEDFHKKVELKEDAIKKVISDLKKISRKNDFNPKWFYMCFVGDPFIYGRQDIHLKTYEMIEQAHENGYKVITLTKGKPLIPSTREDDIFIPEWFGISLVSIDSEFKVAEEKGSAPYRERFKGMMKMSDRGSRLWVSMEPYPTPNIIEQDVENVLERMMYFTDDKVDKLIFGRWNYDDRAKMEGHEEFYIEQAEFVSDWCKNNGIEVKIKDDILRAVR